MAKEELINFRCDQCKKLLMIHGKEGFPYKEGWCYLYSCNVKIAKQKHHRAIKDFEGLNLKDNHFCSRKCLLDFITKKINDVSVVDIKKDLEVNKNDYVFEFSDEKIEMIKSIEQKTENSSTLDVLNNYPLPGSYEEAPFEQPKKNRFFGIGKKN